MRKLFFLILLSLSLIGCSTLARMIDPTPAIKPATPEEYLRYLIDGGDKNKLEWLWAFVGGVTAVACIFMRGFFGKRVAGTYTPQPAASVQKQIDQISKKMDGARVVFPVLEEDIK